MKKYTNNKSKLFSSTILVTAAVVATQVPVSAQSDFTDFTPAHSGFNEVVSLVNAGIITGYEDGSFRPYENIRRDHVALIITRALNLKTPANPESVLSIYDDVKVDDLYFEAIAAVTKSDIFIGSNGSFEPDSSITREQMASVLVRGFGFEETDSHINLVDIESVGHSHRQNVKILAQHGIVIGKTNDLGEKYFDPNAAITRAQFGMVMDRAVRVANGEVLTDAPTVSNVMISGTETVGETLTVHYDYEDLEGDKEGDSIIKWYRADSAAGENKQLIKEAAEASYKLTNNDEGKYLSAEVTPVAKTGNPTVGEAVESKSTGEIKAKEGTAPEVSNLVMNGSENVGEVLSITYDYADADGDEEGDSEYQWYRADSAAGANEVAVEGATGTQYQLTKEDEDKYIRFEITPVSKTGTPTRGDAMSIKSTGNIGMADGSAPEAQNLKISGKLLVASTLKGSYVYYDADDDKEDGTTIQWYREDASGNKERIEAATAREYTLTAEDEGKYIYFEVTPKAATGKQKEGISRSAVTTGAIQAAEGSAPEAQEVSLSGTEIVGQTLTGSYKFHDADGDKEEGTTIQWYRADENGNKESIEGANGSKYTLTTKDEGKLIYFEVTPRAATGNQKEGESVSVATSGKIEAKEGSAPEAKHVTINGSETVGQTLKVTYDFEDVDGDEEGDSAYQWYRADSAAGANEVAIEGATDTEYKLTNKDEGKYIRVEVTPISKTGTPAKGEAVSAKSTGEITAKQGSAPEAKNVSITGTLMIGGKLTGVYTYSHPEDVEEGNSTYQWYRDGTLIEGATKQTYTLTLTDLDAIISFEVTPVAETGDPKQGDSQKVDSSSKVKNNEGASKTALLNAVNHANDLLENAEAGERDGDYPKEAMDTLKDAINEADKILNKENNTQGALDLAKAELQRAVEQFEQQIVKVNRQQLELAIIYASKMNRNLFTDDSLVHLDQALLAAKETFNKEKPTQQEVDSAFQHLNQAMNNLDPVEGINKEPFRYTIFQAKDLVESVTVGEIHGDYPQSAVNELNDAITEAEDVISDEQVKTQEEIDHAKTALETVIQTFKDSQVVVDKSELTRLIDDAFGLVETDYTKESWDGLVDAWNIALGLEGKEKVTQDEIDTAVHELREAIRTLEKKEQADKSLLLSKITNANDLANDAKTDGTDGSFIDTAIEDLRSAITQAQEVYDNAYAKQSDVDQALESLNQAVERFNKSAIVVNRLNLETTIAYASQLQESDYTTDSWIDLEAALLDAQAEVDNDDATQASINEAQQQLVTVISNLIPDDTPAVNTQVLLYQIFIAQQKVDGAVEGDKEGNHPQAAIDDLQSVITQASDVIDQVNNNNAAQSEANAAITALLDAIKAFNDAEVKVDKSSLSNAIDIAKSLKESNYTEASWADLQAEITAAEIIENTLAVSQQEVDDVLRALSSAIRNLEDQAALQMFELQLAIVNAKTLHENAVEGDADGQYENGSKSALQTAINQAQGVVDTATEQAEIDQAITDLQSAVDQFNVKKVSVNKQNLNIALTLLSTLDSTKYTSDSWSNVNDQKIIALGIMQNSAASQTEVDEALNYLNNAIDALVAEDLTNTNPTTQAEFNAILQNTNPDSNGEITIDLSDFGSQSLTVNDSRTMNLNIVGSKTFTGNVTVNAPNATVTIGSGITVNGTLIVKDVNNNSLINQGNLQDVDIRDNDGSRFFNDGGNVGGTLTISGKGTVELEGNLDDVAVTNPSATVRVASGSNVTFSEVHEDADVTDADGNKVNPADDEQAEVDAVADGISSTMTVGQDVKQLELPTVADGYTVSISSVEENQTIITIDGVIHPPETTTTVDVTFTVTKDGTEFTADKVVAVTVERGSEDTTIDFAAELAKIGVTLQNDVEGKGYSKVFFDFTDVGESLKTTNVKDIITTFNVTLYDENDHELVVNKLSMDRHLINKGKENERAGHLADVKSTTFYYTRDTVDKRYAWDKGAYSNAGPDATRPTKVKVTAVSIDGQTFEKTYDFK